MHHMGQNKNTSSKIENDDWEDVASNYTDVIKEMSNEEDGVVIIEELVYSDSDE